MTAALALMVAGSAWAHMQPHCRDTFIELAVQHQEIAGRVDRQSTLITIHSQDSHFTVGEYLHLAENAFEIRKTVNQNLNPALDKFAECLSRNTQPLPYCDDLFNIDALTQFNAQYQQKYDAISAQRERLDNALRKLKETATFAGPGTPYLPDQMAAAMAEYHYLGGAHAELIILLRDNLDSLVAYHKCVNHH